MSEVVYECRQAKCPMGTTEQPGRFSGNEGTCPTCFNEGVATTERITPLVGFDEYQTYHDRIGTWVKEGTVTRENAQTELRKLVSAGSR